MNGDARPTRVVPAGIGTDTYPFRTPPRIRGMPPQRLASRTAFARHARRATPPSVRLGGAALETLYGFALLCWVGLSLALVFQVRDVRGRLDRVEAAIARTTPAVPARAVRPESLADRACRRADAVVRARPDGGPLCGD